MISIIMVLIMNSYSYAIKIILLFVLVQLLGVLTANLYFNENILIKYQLEHLLYINSFIKLPRQRWHGIIHAL